jgi:hypothetical protein
MFHVFWGLAIMYITHIDWSSTPISSSQIGLDQFIFLTMLAMYNFGPMEEKDGI